MTELIYPELSYTIQGACYDVFNELSCLDLSEQGWEKALLIALNEGGLSTRRQVEYELRYKGYRIGRFFTDVLVEDKILLELKALAELLPINEAQLINYLKATNLKLGLLVNFGGPELQIKRLPNFLSNHSNSRRHAWKDQPADHLLYSELTGQLRGLLYEVHSELGPDFMHMHYRRAAQIELRLHGLPYEIKRDVPILFRGQVVEQRDVRLILVDRKVLLAAVAVREISPVLKGRFSQYLRLLGLKLGLIANFYTSSLQIEAVRRGG